MKGAAKTNPRPLLSFWAVTKLIPFVVRPEVERGYAQVVAGVPRALRQFGADVRVVAPLFRETAEALEREGFHKNLQEDLFALRIRIGAREFEARVKGLDVPFDPSYPIYLIDEKHLFYREGMYNHYHDNAMRFAAFCKFALKLPFALKSLNEIDRAPDDIEGHDWQTFWLPQHINNFRKGKEEEGEREIAEFYRDGETKSIIRVHSFKFRGGVIPPDMYETGLLGRDMLEIGLEEADIAYARSLAYIDGVAREEEGRPLGNLIKRKLREGRLVGLRSDDMIWSPDMELTPELALDDAEHVLGIRRHLLNRDIGVPLMERAKQTSPPLVWEVLTPRERIERSNPEASLKSILEFLETDKTRSAFEHALQESKLGEFVYGPDKFHPGDVDMLLSAGFDLSKSENNKVIDAFGKKDEVPLYEVLKKLGVVRHMIRMFESLRRIASAQDLSVEELKEVLLPRGAPDEVGEAGLSTEVQAFTHFSGIYNRLSKNTSVFRAFIFSVLMHDIGKCIELETHPQRAIDMLKDLRGFSALLSKEERDYVRNIIRHHSTFGDSVVIKEANPKSIEKVFKIYLEDQTKRHLFLEVLILIGVADMDAARGERGLLSKQKLKNLVNLHQALITANDLFELTRNLARFGYAPEQWGNVLWNAGVVRERDKKRERERSKKIARNELIQYCRRYRPQISVKEFKRRLGSIEYTWHLKDIISEINDPGLRARFLIKIVELSTHLQAKKLIFLIEDKERLLEILKKKRIFLPIDTLSEFKYESDDKSGAVRISLASESE